MNAWHCVEAGAGRPLVLLHGIGMSHAAWKPVVPLLALRRRVLAFDVAGFGSSPPLPPGTPPDQENLLASLRVSLQRLGVEGPVDIAGNSMGGLLAIEAARLGLARSVVALSPGGLWIGNTPAGLKGSFDFMRWSMRKLPRLSEALLRIAPLRSLLMAVPVSVGSWRMPAQEAVNAARTFVAAPAFDETFRTLRAITGAESIRIPLTVAFGSRDWLLTRRRYRNRSILPPHTRWLTPRGWGHVPMWDDPAGVAGLILEGTQ